MSARIVSGVNALPKVVLSHGDGSTAEVYLHGAHVTSWIPAGGREVIFVSRRSLYARGTAIRGGIPVIFPQFAGLGPLPKHGFARTSEWQLANPVAVTAGPASHAALRLQDSDVSRALWPHAFLAELDVMLGDRALHVELRVTNTGVAPFDFTSALHTYLRVRDVRRTRVRGLRGTRYTVTGQPGLDHVDEGDELAVMGELDRVYENAPPALELDDRGGGRIVRIEALGFPDAVVWNPWAEKGRALPDMAADEYLDMVCIEAARIAAPVHLAPRASWTGRQSLCV